MNIAVSGRHVITSVLAGALVASLAIGAAVAEGRPPPTLREAIDAAYARHPERQTLTAHENEVSMLARRASSLIAGHPSIDTSYKTDQIGSDDGFREWEAGVSLPLWKPGQRRAAANVANDAAEVVEYRAQNLLLTVAGEVRERMWEAALMKNNLDLATKEGDTAVALEQSVRRRVELGELARTDLLLARDSALTRQAAYLRAQKEAQNALRSYETYTGMGRLPRRRGETRAEATTVPEDHAQLAEVAAAIREAQARTVETRRAGGGSPEVFVGANGERGATENDYNNRLSVSLSLPFGAGAHLKPEVARAQRVYAEAQAQYDALRRRLELALSEAAQEVASVQAEYELAQQQNQLAQKSMQLAQVAFDAGESSLLDLLRVQGLAFAAERREKELRITRQRAIARYNQAAGVLP